MSDDLVLIVDEHDVPVGSATRKEMWEKGLWHRIVHVIVEDENGNILIQKRSPQMRLWPNCWTDSASGHVDAGEDYETAARREYYEELGQNDLVKLEELGVREQQGEFEGKILNRFHKYYRTKVESSKFKPELQAEELTEVRWVSRAELHELVTDHPDQVTPGLPQIAELYYPI